MPSPKNRVWSLVAVRGTAVVVAGRVGVRLVVAMRGAAGNAVDGVGGRVSGVVAILEISETWGSAELSGVSPMTAVVVTVEVAGGSSAAGICEGVCVCVCVCVCDVKIEQ